MKHQPKKHMQSAFRSHMTDILPADETAVIYGDRCIHIRGCRKILIYSPEEICLRMKHRILKIRGSDLMCSSFSGGCTTLKGTLSSVELLKEERT